jgi:TonB-dependent receptor
MRARKKRVAGESSLGLILLPIIFFLGSVVAAGGTLPEQTTTFDIPQQRADLALTEFAEQADLTLVFPSELVQEKSANVLIGEYTLEEGIRILLAGTGLNPTFSNRVVLSIAIDEESKSEGDRMNIRERTGLSAILAAVFLAPIAGAQDAPDTIEEIIVTGNRGSLARSLNDKRAADGIVDGISAKDIGDFPDLNITESLQRITGVAITRILGEGQQVTVRGLAPQFTRVTINGQTVTSGASGVPGISTAGRGIDFDIFASELFNNVTLSKTPSASLTEGGLAATIDMQTARPFDYDDGSGDGSVIAVNAQGTFNDRSEATSPRVSLIASSTNLAGGRLGFLGSISYSESDLRQDGVEGFRWLLTDYDLDGDGINEFDDVEIPFIPRYVLEQFERERLGITAALQARPTDDFEINFDVAYAQFDELRTRYSIDGLLRESYPPIGPVEVDSTGRVTRLTLNGNTGGGVSSRSENLHSPTENELTLINIDSAWDFAEGWQARFKFGYSDASSSEVESRAVYQALNTFTYDFTDPIFVSLEPGENILDPGTDVDFTDPSDFSHNQSRRIDTDVDDRDVAFQADVEHFLDGSWISSVSAGLRYNEREKEQKRFDGRLSSSAGAIPLSSPIATPLPVNDFFDGENSPNIPSRWVAVDFNAFFADPVVGAGTFSVPQRFIDSFTISEDTFAAYVQANFESGLWRGNFGGRFVDTDQTSQGFLGDGTPISQSQSYSEFLPSLNVVAEVTDNFLIRIAASRTLTRPTLFQLSPGGNVAPTSLTATLGNPDLDPFRADQFDLSFEWYFGSEGLASATFFNKDVESFISNVTTQSMINAGTQINDAGEDVSDAIYTVTRPVNGEGATVKGFELSLQTPLSGLPAPWDGLGFLANYTYADSKSTIVFNGQTVTTLLPGQSESSYNLIGYYEKGSFSGRLTYAWRDGYLSEVRASDAQRSNFTDAYGQLDASIRYTLTDNITLTFDALNLTEEAVYLYSERKDRNRAYGLTGRFISFGIRAKFD